MRPQVLQGLLDGPDKGSLLKQVATGERTGKPSSPELKAAASSGTSVILGLTIPCQTSPGNDAKLRNLVVVALCNRADHHICAL